jgi:arginase
MSRPAVRVIGAPMDLGQNRRGVDMGPSAVRYAGLKARLEGLGYEVHDQGNVAVPNPEEEVVVGQDRRLRAVAGACQRIYEMSKASLAAGDFALFLGGDHSMSIGTVAAAAEEGPIGLIWVDAHGDFNTPQSSPSGNIHGMPVATLTGEGPEPLLAVGSCRVKVEPAHIVMVGIRDLDLLERERLRQSDITVYTMRHVDELGMAAVARQTLSRLRQVKRIHVSLDMDGLDPDEAPGVGTPVPGGISYREAHLLMEILSDSHRVGSMDVVEVNPILDKRNRTAELAVELIASLLGQKIM